MTISIRMTDAESDMVKSYAQMHGKTVSEFIRQTTIERIEDELDLKAYNEAIAAYRNHPKTYTLDEIERELFE